MSGLCTYPRTEGSDEDGKNKKLLDKIQQILDSIDRIEIASDRVNINDDIAELNAIIASMGVTCIPALILSRYYEAIRRAGQIKDEFLQEIRKTKQICDDILKNPSFGIDHLQGIVEQFKSIPWYALPGLTDERETGKILMTVQHSLHVIREKAKNESPDIFNKTEKCLFDVDVIQAKYLTLEEKRGLAPFTLKGAMYRAQVIKDEIRVNGWHAKYSDDEIRQMVEDGTCIGERFMVRIMPGKFINGKNPGDEMGKLGGPLELEDGSKVGAKYWNTTFDHIEDVDLNAELALLKLGLAYEKEQEYAFIIVDMEKSMELTQVECFPATYEGISQFVNKEFPSLFPKEITDRIMNDEFQEIYRETYHTIVNSNRIKPNEFAQSLDEVYTENKETIFLKRRNVMHLKIGNSELFAGNGITANRIQKSPNQYGCPEFFNFDRKAITIKCYKESDALIYKMI